MRVNRKRRRSLAKYLPKLPLVNMTKHYSFTECDKKSDCICTITLRCKEGNEEESKVAVNLVTERKEEKIHSFDKKYIVEKLEGAFKGEEKRVKVKSSKEQCSSACSGPSFFRIEDYTL